MKKILILTIVLGAYTGAAFAKEEFGTCSDIFTGESCEACNYCNIAYLNLFEVVYKGGVSNCNDPAIKDKYIDVYNKLKQEYEFDYNYGCVEGNYAGTEDGEDICIGLQRNLDAFDTISDGVCNGKSIVDVCLNTLKFCETKPGYYYYTYGDEYVTIGSAPCPSGGTSAIGAFGITSCYLPAGYTGSDETGTWQYTQDCHYTE